MGPGRRRQHRALSRGGVFRQLKVAGRVMIARVAPHGGGSGVWISQDAMWLVAVWITAAPAARYCFVTRVSALKRGHCCGARLVLVVADRAIGIAAFGLRKAWTKSTGFASAAGSTGR